MRKGITAGIWSLMSTLFLLQITSAAERPNRGVSYDVVITNGKVVDERQSWFYADVAIKNGKIAKIGKVDPMSGKSVIDAKGMVVSPGFIDLHTHTDHARSGGRQCRERGAPRRDARCDRRKLDGRAAQRRRDRRVQGRSETAQRRRYRLDNARRVLSPPQ